MRAVEKAGWSKPTPVQSAALPLALQGKDLLVQARTGTGKTACYALPLLQTCLTLSSASTSHGVRAVVLVPTKELSRQVRANLESLARYCGNLISVVELSAAVDTVKEQKNLLRDNPSIVVATPARIAGRIADGSLAVATCSALVIDEADLVLGYGYADDVSSIIKALPSSRQTFLMSATLGAEVSKLQKEALNRPALLKLEEEEPLEGDGDGLEGNARLRQLSLRAERASDRFLITYVMIKLRLIQGKTLVFVNSINRAFKLRLFLRAFYIQAEVLNSELPENSRNYIVEEFDNGKYNVLIATDESQIFASEKGLAEALVTKKPNTGTATSVGKKVDDGSGNRSSSSDSDGSSNSGEEEEEKEEHAMVEAAPASKKQRMREMEQREYGVSRGVDFRNVANVINFDFPSTPEAYVHRIGRTARAGARGKAISFICSDKEHAVLHAAEALQKQADGAISPFAFKMSAVEGFRYRVEDVLSGITRNQIREARADQVKAEILRSKALKSHFEEHPRDLEALTTTPVTSLSRRVKAPELKKIPDYLRPTAADSNQIRQVLGGAKGVDHSAPKLLKAAGKKKPARRGNDPLKSLQIRKRK